MTIDFMWPFGVQAEGGYICLLHNGWVRDSRLRFTYRLSLKNSFMTITDNSDSPRDIRVKDYANLEMMVVPFKRLSALDSQLSFGSK